MGTPPFILGTEETGLAPLAPAAAPQAAPAQQSKFARIAAHIGQFLPVVQRVVAGLAAAAPDLEKIGDTLVAGSGSPLQQQALAEKNDLALRRQQVGMQQANMNLQRQLFQRELDNYQSPQQELDAAFQQFQREQNYRQEHPERPSRTGIASSRTQRVVRTRRG